MTTLFDPSSFFHGDATAKNAIPRPQSAFEDYFRIDPVAIAYRKGGRIYVSEFNHSGKLLKALHRLGRQKIPLRGLISGRGAASTESLAALNCYLEHSFARQSLARVRLHLHRYAWHDLQRAVPVVWHL